MISRYTRLKKLIRSRKKIPLFTLHLLLCSFFSFVPRIHLRNTFFFMKVLIPFFFTHFPPHLQLLNPFFLLNPSSSSYSFLSCLPSLYFASCFTQFLCRIFFSSLFFFLFGQARGYLLVYFRLYCA